MDLADRMKRYENIGAGQHLIPNLPVCIRCIRSQSFLWHEFVTREDRRQPTERGGHGGSRWHSACRAWSHQVGRFSRGGNVALRKVSIANGEAEWMRRGSPRPAWYCSLTRHTPDLARRLRRIPCKGTAAHVHAAGCSTEVSIYIKNN
jgi:hypothetical protein